MFRDLIGKSMEVYVEDLLVKSKEGADHIGHLAEAFGILRRFQMQLNSAKYLFRVSSGKLLRHPVSRQGIEASPKKIQAVI